MLRRSQTSLEEAAADAESVAHPTAAAFIERHGLDEASLHEALDVEVPDFKAMFLASRASD